MNRSLAVCLASLAVASLAACGGGATPLHKAAHDTSNPSVIRALIEAGTDPAARDDDGKTPFYYVKNNEALKGTAAYRLLKEGRFE